MGTKSGSLLRLFQSEYFDAHLHMLYLLRMEQSGVQDYLVNELYKMEDDDVDFYLPQLCQVALLRYQTSSLHRFLLDKASKSMHFALRIHWLMQSFVEDGLPQIAENAMTMVNACETAVVNAATQAASSSSSHAAQQRRSSEDRRGYMPDAAPDTEPRMPRSSSCPELSTDLVGSDVEGGGAGAPEIASDTMKDGEVVSPSRRCSTPPAGSSARSPSGRVLGGSRPRLASEGSNAGALAPVSPVASPSHSEALRHLSELSQAHTAEQKAAQIAKLPAQLPNAYLELGEPVAGWVASVVNEGTLRGEMRQFILKQRRCDYFNTQNHLVTMVVKLSTALIATAEKEERKAFLASTMDVLNRWLFDRRSFMTLNNEGSFSLLGLHFPILRQRDTRQQILRIQIEQCRVFSSATRAPFLLVYETANLDEEPLGSDARVADDAPAEKTTDVDAAQDNEGDAAENKGGTSPSNGNANNAARKSGDVLDCDIVVLPQYLTESLCGCVVNELGDSVTAAVSSNSDALDAGSDAGGQTLEAFRYNGQKENATKRLRRRLLEVTPEEWLRMPASRSLTPQATPVVPTKCSRCPQAKAWRDIEEAAAEGSSLAVPAECANCPKLKRAELAARTRLTIWGESWEDRRERIRSVSPFGGYPSWALNAVVVKGGDDLRQELLASQVIKVFSDIFKEAELPLWLHPYDVMVVNSSSGFLEYFSDTLSVNGIKKFFPGKSLGEIFKVAFADRLFEAKQNFIESYAAYSLVVWFLQVKDRHNDNLLMKSTGHVVHLDFGFMLSNSPGGNMAFEQSPFKLTQEFLDVMDGECSGQYEYFRTLVIRGFLEARKHVDRIILPVRMLLTGSKLPCFREGPDWVLQSLNDRFFVNLTEAACIEKIVDLIDTSVNNWRTIQYDNYQRIVNGIL